MINVFSRRSRIARRLSAISARLPELRAELQVLAEQLVHMRQVEDDSRTASLVEGTAQSARDATAATTDRQRTERARDRVRDQIADLTAEQDRLLEAMLDHRNRGAGP